MRLLRGLLMLAVGATMIGAAPAIEDAADGFALLRRSAELARIGEVRRDPLLLIAAARLRRSVDVTLEGEAVDRAAEWLARAEALGAADPRILGLVADTRAEASKGRAAGPRVSQALLSAGQRMRFAETFRAGRPAVVYIEGDGDTDVALSVGSACRDLSPGDIKICTWTPRRAERVTVEIANTGRIRNRVLMGTN